jgi:hypothetical protein
MCPPDSRAQKEIMDLHEREALPGPNFNALKEKQRAIRDAFPEALALRVHRALSWLGRAEDEVDDTDVRFILLWVGFNSAYAGDLSAEIDS